MSLQLWLPFDGDLNNKGLSNATPSGSSITFGGLGKIGVQCLKSANKVSYDLLNDNISTSTMSCSFWARSDVYTGTSTAWWQMCSFTCSDSTKFHIYCVSNARYKIEYNPEMNVFCDTTLWHHLTYVLNGTRLDIYLDGVHAAGGTVTNANRILSSINFGCNTVCINDFKLYDHCLTIQEIERDYASLLIHYPFRDRYVENTTNLLTDGKFAGYGGLTIGISQHSYDANNVCTLTTAASSSASGSARAYVPLNVLTNGASYSISYKWKLISGTGSLKPGDWCDGAVTVRKNDYNGEYYEVEAFLHGRATYDSTYRFLDFNNIGSNSVYEIWDVQLERKDYCTPFTPNTRTGYPIEDCSGRGYDAINSKELTVQKDSMRNSYYTHFTSGNSIQIPSPFSAGNSMTEFSIAMWIYLDSSNGYMYIFSTAHSNPTASSAGWFSLNTEGTQMWFYSGGTYWKCGSGTVPTGEWHHIGLTFKDGTMQYYYDGKPFMSPITQSKTAIPSTAFFGLGDSYTGT